MKQADRHTLGGPGLSQQPQPPPRLVLDSDRLLPADPGVRRIARGLLAHVRSLPIVSPHGHLDAAAFATDAPIGDPATELISRDHYLLRMLYSQGVPLESLGVAPRGARDGQDSGAYETDGRQIWRRFAEHYRLFRGTPSKLWLDFTLAEVFGVTVGLSPETADEVYDQLVSALATAEFRPRALYARFGIEFLATTDGALDELAAHDQIRRSGWAGRVVPTFRPDAVVDPDLPDFLANLHRLGEVTGEDTTSWRGYLQALRRRREAFLATGATATDHGHRTVSTADLSIREADALFTRLLRGTGEAGDAELFRAAMLTEMAAMSLEDGLVLQLHAGAHRNHNPALTSRFGPDQGADIPAAMNYVDGLAPLLAKFGNEPRLTVIIYTLDESAYSRELAPLAGHYPALRLGPPWWFHDSPEGIRRYRRAVTETAGFANTVGFNDDARSLLTIPARHDVARRIDAGFLADLVAEHRLTEQEAYEVAEDLAYRLARSAFRVPQ
jgi:glucuronate isomerase